MTFAVADLPAAAIADPDEFARRIVEPCQPVAIRGLVSAWPAVRAGKTSPRAFGDYVAPFACERSIEAFVGDPSIRGRFFYDVPLTGFNFERRTLPFAELVAQIVAGVDRPQQASLYAGSVPVDAYLPGFRGENPLPVLPSVAPRIWIGHASTVSAHYDTMDNLACVAAGRRRFTLYAPALVGDLYPGPIDHTMAGQPVSLAASSDAPIGTFPRFDAIRDQALTVELAPGDALYLPKLWWHQVEALDRFNVLVNYWWDAATIGPDAPYTSLMLAMIAIAERPAPERDAWRALFDHYVFRTDGHPLRHLPAEQHGVLGPLRPHNYGRIRAWIMTMMRGGA